MTRFAGFSAACAAVVLALAATASTAAAADATGFYVRGDIGGSFGRDLGGSVLNGDGFEGDSGSSVLLEAGVGYHLPSNFRVDLTAGYRPGFEVSSQESLSGVSATAKADIRSWALLANVYYDIPTGTRFSPYLGGGVGVAFNRLETVTYRFGAAEFTEEGKSKTSFAWTLAAGVGFAATDNISIDLGYRYIDLGEIRTSGDSSLGAVNPVDADLKAHEVKIGARYRF